MLGVFIFTYCGDKHDLETVKTGNSACYHLSSTFATLGR